MKASKSPEATDVTPSKKKLKQALLPFKIINESPAVVTPVTPESRKRKLSATEAETVTKVNKICKENGVDLVVISDDESRDGKPNEKLPNPYVKLVDTAFKKKLQKSKAKKKKIGKKNVVPVTENSLANGTDAAEIEEAMDVDDPVTKSSTEKNESISKETANNLNNIELIESIVLEDSSNSDIQQSITNKTTEEPATNSDKNDSKNNDDKGENAVASSDNSDNESSNSEKVDTSDDEQKDKISNEKESDSNEKEQDLNEKGSESNEKESDSNGKVHNSNEKEPDINAEELDTKNEEPLVNEDLPVTPKRSSRVKNKMEENNNKNSPTSKLNESLTQRQSRSSSATKMDESLNESTTSNTNLTPKQLQKKMESAKKREEREKERVEREKKKQQEKEERAKQRQEKEDQKKREREEKEEAKRKEREEKEEQRKKEKEEKEKQKEMEKKLREEKEELKRKEKEEKEEQKKKEREAREEEKRKKQEALELEKQEQELKKKKAAEAFLNFFVPKQKVDKDQPTFGMTNNSMLTNFTVKSDMRLAPTTRSNLSEEKAQALETYIKEQNVDESSLYLKMLKNGDCKPLSSGKTWPLTDKDDDDVILVEDELPPLDGALETMTIEPVIREKLRPKLFSFHENRRPPYWGTWRKKSKVVKPRRPFGLDEKQLDYEVDSDEEWEEEQEGESIDGSAAGSDDEQGPDEYEVDNEVFVPHGYLSDEEATMDEEDKDDILSLSPGTQKQRLKHLEDEFESEMKKPTEKLKPRLYGLLWENSDGGKPDNCVDAIWNYFGKLAMIINDDPTPFMQPANEPGEQEKKKVKKKKAEGDSPKTEKKKRKIEEKDKTDIKKVAKDAKKNQPGINMFLAKIKST